MLIGLTPRDHDLIRNHLGASRHEHRNKTKLPGARKNYGRSSRSPQSGIPFYNDSGETVPAFGVMRITGYNATNRYLTISKPNTSFTALYLINTTGRTVPYQSTGSGRFLTGDEHWGARWALYNPANTPAVGESWGVIPSTWWLGKNGPGFLILGGADGTKVSVLQHPPGQILVYNDSGGAIAAAGTNTVSVYGGVAGSESDSGFNITVYNRSSVSWPSNKYGFVEIVNGQAYVSPHQT